jgi:hypothetical protein
MGELAEIAKDIRTETAERAADQAEVDRFDALTVGLNEAQLDPAGRERFAKARRAVDLLRLQIDERKARIEALRHRASLARRRSRVVLPPVQRRSGRRLAHRVRRTAHRRTASHKATADPEPPPKRKSPAAATRGPLKNTSNSSNSSGVSNTRIAAAAQASHCWGGRA